MAEAQKTRVAVNGYGAIGKRVAAAVMRQDDMSRAGVSDVMTDWRARIVTRNGFALFGATKEHAETMRPAWTSREHSATCSGRLTSWWTAQAIVIPETIDAIRALTGTVQDAATSIAKTNAALGIEPALD